MARHVEGPWYRAGKNTWYATVRGEKVSLKVKGPENRGEAVRAWHRLMAGVPGDVPAPRPTPAPEPASKALTVAELADLFLSDAAARLKPLTVGQYRTDLALFRAAFARTPIDRIGPADVSRWLHGMAVGETTKGVRLRSVSACFGWAVRYGFLDGHPIKRVPKPRTRSRGQEAVIPADVQAKLIEMASPTFRRVLAVLHGTGCRPGEVGAITAANFDPANGLVRLEVHKSDRHGKPRLIFVPSDVAELLSALAVQHPTGPLLRWANGAPWTGRGVTSYMQKLKKRAGVRAMAYGYRHGFATDALAKGLPDAQVAALLGHSSTAMLHKHYSHLTGQSRVLRDALAKVRGETPTSEK